MSKNSMIVVLMVVSLASACGKPDDEVVMQSRCGNSVVDPGEQCDDGNTVPGDGCSVICRIEICGNGVLDPGEQCDDANNINGDGCSSTCRDEVCGNGILDFGEHCDDGNTVPGDGCSPMCTVELTPRR